jgi:hypothetical protein
MILADEAKAQIIRLAERFAVRVLVAPRDEREALYAIARQSAEESAKQLGCNDSQAGEWADNVEALVRIVVAAIERGDGASGGTA